MIPTFETTTWGCVEATIKKLNPQLHKIINKLSPDKSYRIYRAKYPFGTIFVENGLFKLPDKNGKMLPITHESIPKKLKEDLSYNKGTNPVSLLLSNQAELYIEEGIFNIPISFGLINPGHMLSTTYVLSSDKTFHPRFKWCICSGARSIFTLPKITNKRSFNRLKKNLSLQCESPKHYSDHFSIFTEITSSLNCEWRTDILFFSKQWFEKIKDEEWRDFYNYLLTNYQKSYQFWTNKFMWDMACAFIIKKKNLKPSLYVANTIQHLLFMAAGATYGMGPAINNKSAPIDIIQKTLIEVFGIKDYLPTIFIPQHFNMYSDQQSPIYYSLNYPNMMEMTLRPRKHESLLTDLYETYAMLTKYIPELKADELNLSGTPLHDIPDKVSFSAFHPDAEPYQLLKSASELSATDRNLETTLINSRENLSLNDSSGYFKGCFQITKK